VSILTLLTDFGLYDHYVASVKGVILQIAPKVTIVDITHQVSPQNVLQAAFVLRQAFECFESGTVHMAVVDPGVGTARAIVAAKYSGQFVLAPDNGLLSLVHRDFVLEELRVVQNVTLFRKTVSATFHGRDIFAPVAGHIAKTGRLADVGPVTDRLSLLDLPEPAVASDGRVRGQILYIDHFGNALTNIRLADLERAARRRSHLAIRVGDYDVGSLRQAYGEVPAGTPVALVGSAGTLEIAVNLGSAAKQLGLVAGQEVVVE
jgi:S-adenosylmethionine hydrolase